MAKIQTVSGEISPEELGVTYCHDHLLFMPPPPFYGQGDPGDEIFQARRRALCC
jgi:predicted metal-dependent phosphotriesterase family hydrolase